MVSFVEREIAITRRGPLRDHIAALKLPHDGLHPWWRRHGTCILDLRMGTGFSYCVKVLIDLMHMEPPTVVGGSAKCMVIIQVKVPVTGWIQIFPPNQGRALRTEVVCS
jgi:hypothetical protein